VGGAYMIAPKKTLTDPYSGTKISLSEQAVSFNIGYKF